MRCSWILSLLLVPCIAASAGVPPQLATTPAPKSGPSGDRMADTREGGETWDDAVAITALPFTDSGATCDNTDDITLPCASSEAPDVVYRYTPAVDQQINVSLCGSGYDTALGIYDASHVNLDCNDDYCGLQSEIHDFQVQAGQTYYFVVDGYSTSCGSYQIDVISASQPCIVECPAGAQIEGEPPCVDGYWDLYNSGCGGAGWLRIQPQDGDCATVCGRSCTYLYNGQSYRDTDWYDVTSAGGPLTVTGRAEFPLQLVIIHVPFCDNLQYVYATGAACEPVTVSWQFDPGQECWIWVGPAVFSGVSESDYTFSVCGIDPAPAAHGACCLQFEYCRVLAENGCSGGIWLGPGTDCDPNPCTADPTAACCLADGTCEMLTESGCAQAQGIWQGAGHDCDPNPCAATPAQRTSWGSIKNWYR